MSRVVVIGAGIAGLSAAYRLIEKGIKNVIVLEASDSIGGLSKSIKKNDFIFDLGPHQIHTEDIRVINFLEKILKDDLIVAKKKASHRFLGKYLNYPLGMNDILFGLPLSMSSACFFDFCKQQVKNLFYEKNKESFESWVISHFGQKMYDIYFGPYTKKVWGLDPKYLHPICAQERIAVQSLMDIILSAFSRRIIKFRNNYKLPHSPYQKVFYYPKYGIGQLADIMTSYIKENGGRIILNNQVKKIVKTENGYDVYTNTNDKYNTDYVVSSMPVNLLKNMLEDVSLTKPKEELGFRALTFVFLELNKKNITDNHWIYFPDKDCSFQRASELRNFSKFVCPEGKSSICFEIPTDYKDEIWNMSDEKLYEKIINDAEKQNYLKKEWVDNFHVAREKYAYPTYDLEYDINLNKIDNYINKFENLFSIGRQGTFEYINIDRVLFHGFDVGDEIYGQL